MTVYVDEDGWLIVSDGGSNSMEILFERCEGPPQLDPIVNNYEGGTNLSYDLGILFLELKFTNVWFQSDSHYEDFMKYLIAWQQAGSLTIAVKKTASTYIAFKGTDNGTSFTMVVPKGGMQGNEKIGKGTQQVYVIRTLRFIEGG